jgi:hypothetical protein
MQDVTVRRGEALLPAPDDGLGFGSGVEVMRHFSMQTDTGPSSNPPNALHRRA